MGDNGIVLVIRSSNSKNTLEEFHEFFGNFKPNNSTARVKLTDSIYKFVNALDIDFSILKYDYFDVNEYKKTLLMTHLLLTKMQNILNY